MDPVSIITKKIRFYPNTVQKKLFNKCFGIHNFFYNRAIEEINKRYHTKFYFFKNHPTCIHCNEPKINNNFSCEAHKDLKIKWDLNINLCSLRNSIMKNDKELRGTSEEWQIDVPYDTRQLAIKDAINAYKSSVALKQQGYVKNFELKYRSKRKNKKIFWCDAKTLNNKWELFRTRLKNNAQLHFRKRDYNKLPKRRPDTDFKIMKDCNSYYILLSVPYDKSKNKYKKIKNNVISCDPGIRCFQTCYDPKGKIIEVGLSQIEKVKRIHNKIDELKSIRTKCKNKRTKQNIRKKYLKKYKKVKDIITDLHNQTTSKLSKSYKSIVLPEFGTSKMLTVTNELDSGVKRMMQTLSFYKFKDKLKLACYKEDTSLYIVTEEYTSKTCTKCGNLKHDLGSSKIYECTKCNNIINRDINGARNILLKHIIC